jgi:hypothetical protein
VDNRLKPEEQLKQVRAQARTLFDQSEAAEMIKWQAPKPDRIDRMLRPDQLTLFLRSLSSQLRSAITEVRATSQDLADLTAELQRLEKQLDRGN